MTEKGAICWHTGRLAAIGLLAGCAGVTPGTAGMIPRDTASLVVQVLATDAQGPQPLASDRPIHTGDRYALLVESGQAGFLYAYRVPSAGTPSTLFSAEPEKPTIEMGGRVHLPRVDWYEMDGAAGAEQVIVVVSQRALSAGAAEQQLRRAAPLVAQDREKTRGAPPPPDPPPPPKVGEKERGSKVYGRFQDGVAVLRFPLQHR